MDVTSGVRYAGRATECHGDSHKEESHTSIVWYVVQYLLLSSGVGLVVTLILKPEVGLHLLWNGLIPLAPLLVVVAPGLWRNVCPMATFSLLPWRLGLSAKQKMSQEAAGRAALIGLLGLLLIVPLRHILLNTDGPATALMLLISAAIAFFMGWRYELRSGWCNTVCPIHPAERLYGQAPALTLSNARCDKCYQCSTPCPDSTKAMSPIISGTNQLARLTGHIMAGCFVGFIWGWYRIPDYGISVGMDRVIEAYGWPFGAGAVTLAFYAILQRWVCKTTEHRTLLVRLYAAAAVSMYYWYRVPSLIGLGPHPGSGMLIDLSASLPDFPVYSHIVTTVFFLWFMILRKSPKNSWLKRPVRFVEKCSN